MRKQITQAEVDNLNDQQNNLIKTGLKRLFYWGVITKKYIYINFNNIKTDTAQKRQRKNQPLLVLLAGKQLIEDEPKLACNN